MIGCGASGLAAALALDAAGADVVVLEGASAAGGVMRSHEAGGFLFDDGPTSVLDRDGTFRAFCRDLAIEGDIAESQPAAKARYVFERGRLVAVPSSAGDLLKSGLFSLLDQARIAREAFIGPGAGEETVAAFLARRFGEKLTARFADMLVSGIFAGDPARLSLDAAFPEVRALEREHGSVLKGLAHAARHRTHPRPALLSLRSGLGSVATAAAARLGSRLRASARVDAVMRRAAGVTGVTVRASGESIDADAVIVATPARAAAALIRDASPDAASELLTIESASVAVVQLGFEEAEIAAFPRGFGVLIPRAAGLDSLGWVFVSDVFAGRAPAGCRAFTGFFGGVLGARAWARADDDLVATALEDLRTIGGLARTPRPAFARAVRFREAIPQYAQGHQRRVADAVAALARDLPGAALAGNYLAGVSIPGALASGRAAAAAALASAGRGAA